MVIGAKAGHDPAGLPGQRGRQEAVRERGQLVLVTARQGLVEVTSGKEHRLHLIWVR